MRCPIKWLCGARPKTKWPNGNRCRVTEWIGRRCLTMDDMLHSLIFFITFKLYVFVCFPEVAGLLVLNGLAMPRQVWIPRLQVHFSSRDLTRAQGQCCGLTGPVNDVYSTGKKTGHVHQYIIWKPWLKQHYVISGKLSQNKNGQKMSRLIMFFILLFTVWLAKANLLVFHLNVWV